MRYNDLMVNREQITQQYFLRIDRGNNTTKVLEWKEKRFFLDTENRFIDISWQINADSPLTHQGLNKHSNSSAYDLTQTLYNASSSLLGIKSGLFYSDQEQTYSLEATIKRVKREGSCLAFNFKSTYETAISITYYLYSFPFRMTIV